MDDPNHEWDISTFTTEPGWVYDYRYLVDCGFDSELAAKYLGVSQGEAYNLFSDAMEAMDIPLVSSGLTRTVRVWGTITYETKRCDRCGLNVGRGSDIYGQPLGTVNTMGEWQLPEGEHARCTVLDYGIDFDPIFYDPYNIPQRVIDCHIRLNKIEWACANDLYYAEHGTESHFFEKCMEELGMESTPTSEEFFARRDRLIQEYLATH